MKVTFNLPKDAAEKLSKLAEAGDDVLRELGILSLEMEGGQVMSTLGELGGVNNSFLGPPGLLLV